MGVQDLRITGSNRRRKLKKKVVAAYGEDCYICGGAPEEVGSMTVDHVVPLSQGGTYDIENLRPCCLGCNQEKAKEER